MTVDQNAWAADVKVSMPRPLTEAQPGLVPMDGFTMTAGGLAHDLSQADWARISQPTLGPVVAARDTVRYDAHLDREPVNGSGETFG